MLTRSDVSLSNASDQTDTSFTGDSLVRYQFVGEYEDRYFRRPPVRPNSRDKRISFKDSILLQPLLIVRVPALRQASRNGQSQHRATVPLDHSA